MIRFGVAATAALAALWLTAVPVVAKDKVKVGFIGPLTGGVSVNGLGGRNSADLAVKLRNADAKAKYEYELVVLDDACTPNVAVQVATKMSADKEIIAAATHYCSSTAIATVDVYHKFGLPVIVWGAVLPDITYRNKYAEIHRVNGTMINQNDANAELISKIGYKTVAFIQGLGPLAEGVLAFREGAPTEKLPGGKFFMDNYNAQKYDNPPEAYGAFAYAAMALILDSIEKVGPDRKKIIDELAKVKDRDSIVGKITFDDHGQNTVPVITKYVIQDGKFVEWDDSEYASGKRKLPGQK